jgi:hypothetical protein
VAVFHLFFPAIWALTFFLAQDPGKQFDLVREQIARVRRSAVWTMSSFVVFVERNLGFEARTRPTHARPNATLT